MSKYGVFSGPYFPIFSPNTGKYGPGRTPYLATFHAVTINGKVIKSSEVLEDLEMAQASNGKTKVVWVKLSCFYTQEGLPVESNEVAAIDKVKWWDYLGRINVEITANDNIDVTLLICAHCVKALELREINAKVHMHSKHSGDDAL